MHFEHTVMGQWVLFLAGAVGGLLAFRLPGNGVAAVALTALPYLGFGLTTGFC